MRFCALAKSFDKSRGDSFVAPFRRHAKPDDPRCFAILGPVGRAGKRAGADDIARVVDSHKTDGQVLTRRALGRIMRRKPGACVAVVFGPGCSKQMRDLRDQVAVICKRLNSEVVIAQKYPPEAARGLAGRYTLLP